MPIPEPEPGLVINYAYLWHHESETGQAEGRKDRPSVIVLSIQKDENGETIVIVLPITHREPEKTGGGVEIPRSVRDHLGLDENPCWIVVAEGNEFIWPGYDLRQRSDGSYAFGFLPPRLFKQVQDAFLALYRAARAPVTPRD